MRLLRYLHVVILLVIEGAGAVATANSEHETSWGPSIINDQKQISLQPLGQKVRGDGWTAQEQDQSVCDAGSRQFTGRVNATEGKSIFFWFLESNDEPNKKPVIVFLNGGPGASSMMGLFGAIGPCLLSRDSNSTIRNPHSWVNHANLLFIDQPAGVGLSTIEDPDQSPTDLDDASADFSTVLNVFFHDIFPQFRPNPLYVAGESFGGAYVPSFVADIQKRLFSTRQPNQQALNVTGIILLNALVSNKYASSSHYELFCRPDSSPLRFNETSCTAMAEAIPECERLQDICEVTLDGNICLAAMGFCSDHVYTFFNDEVEAHRRSPYDLRRDCPHPPVCDAGENGETGSPSIYLNKPEIQKLLGFDTPINYTGINFQLNSRWSQRATTFLPSTPQITYLLNKARIAVLVVNGNNDVSVNTAGIIRTYDALRWHGQAEYRQRQFQTWKWADTKGVWHQGGQHKGWRGLDLYTVDDAGHVASADQREAVTSIIGSWLQETHY